MPTPRDFLTNASSQSAELFQQSGADASDPLNSSISFCVPSAPVDPIVARRMTLLYWISGIGGALGIAIGGGIALGLKFRMIHARNWDNDPLLIAGACTLIGIFGLFVAAAVERRFITRMLITRLPAEPGAAPPLPIGLTNGHPNDQPFRSTDKGLLVLYPSRRRVLIEGMSYRYLVRGEDVQSIRMRADDENNRPVLTFRIGAAVLSLVVSPKSAREEFQSQFGRMKLYEQLKQTLQV